MLSRENGIRKRLLPNSLIFIIKKQTLRVEYL